MILIFLAGLILLASSVVLFARAAAVSRVRAVQTLGHIDAYGFTGAAPADVETETTLGGPLDHIAQVLGAIAADRLPLMREADVRRELMAAGLYRLEPRKLMGYQLLACVGLGILWLWATPAVGFPAGLSIIVTVLAFVIGWYLPLMLVKRKARARLGQIEYDLPELIDLLVVTVEAGLSFNASLQVASDRLKGPLGDELRLCLQEQNMGLSVNEALRNMLARTETPSVRSFVRSIIQGELLGISIGQIMRNLADEMRKRRKAAAEEKAQKAPIKMLFPLIFLIFPAMFVVLLGPALFAFFDALG